MGTQRTIQPAALLHGSQDRLHTSASGNPCFWPGSQEKQAIEALRETCFGNGHTSEELGDMLVERGLFGGQRKSGQAHVRAACNPGKTEYFSPSELMAIMAYTGNYTWLKFQCRMLGLTDPELADPAEQIRIAQEEVERHETAAQEARLTLQQLQAEKGRNEPMQRWNPPKHAKFCVFRGGRSNANDQRTAGTQGPASGDGSGAGSNPAA